MQEQVTARRRYRLSIGSQNGGFRARMLPANQAPARYRILPRRGGALFIDLLVWIAITEIVAYASGRSRSLGYHVMPDGTEQYLGAALHLLSPVQAYILMCLWFGYLVVTEAVFGATLGKLVFGIRVMRSGGTRAGARAAALRQAPRFVLLSIIFFVTQMAVEPWYFLAEASLAWSHDRRQRISDRLADTVVVRRSDVAGLTMGTTVS